MSTRPPQVTGMSEHASGSAAEQQLLGRLAEKENQVR